ncbi:MAG: polyphosphate kinase 1 [Spirochaetaceae bacterium]
MSEQAIHRYFSRDLSWVEFNARVLEEALDESTPLLERWKFLCIVAANFDEFFMVRVASLTRQRDKGLAGGDPSGLSPETQLKRIAERVGRITARAYECLHGDILPRLETEGISLVRRSEYTGSRRKFLREYFAREVFPVLTPVRYEPGASLPLPGNNRLHVGVLLEPEEGTETALLADDRGSRDGDNHPEESRGDEELLAVVQLAPVLERIIYIPDKEHRLAFTLLEDVVLENAEHLFPGYRITSRGCFRVTRDADLGVDEERDEDFVEAMEQVLESRRHSAVVRLTVAPGADRLGERLEQALGVSAEEVSFEGSPLALGDLASLAELSGFEHLRYPPMPPLPPRDLSEDESMFSVLKRRDVLMHQPFESFEPVIRLIEQAAADPAVLSVKMTLYRTSGDSPVVRALEEAAERGKQVTALVELKARFDEERNIRWAERLERAGVIVIYGIARLKVHAKAMMIVRREPEGVVRYVHLGTGNYNDRTATLYTDFGMLTTREEIAYETNLFFNAISGYSAIPALTRLALAPVAMKSRLLQFIDRERRRSSAETPGRIMAKLNSLADPEVVDALYRASSAGVEVLLNVRGICTLVPGVPGLSENITVVSIVDRFLEHGRAFYFHNGGAWEVYLSSADWMPRNLDRRVELMFPVEREELKRRIRHVLEVSLADTAKGRELRSDGSWERRHPKTGEEPLRSQWVFYEEARRYAQAGEPANRREFSVRRRPP